MFDARSIVVLRFVILCTIFFIDLSVARKKSFSADNDVVYELYTPEHPADYEQLQPAYGTTIHTETAFNVNRPTRIFIHGFLAKRKTFLKYAEAYLANGNFNVIVVNWLKGSSTYNYIKARGRVDEVSLLT